MRKLAKKASSSLCTLAPRKLSTAPTKAWQGQLAGAGEGVGVIAAAGQFGKNRAAPVIAEVGRQRLYNVAVLRRKSFQPRKKIKKPKDLRSKVA